MFVWVRATRGERVGSATMIILSRRRRPKARGHHLTCWIQTIFETLPETFENLEKILIFPIRISIEFKHF